MVPSEELIKFFSRADYAARYARAKALHSCVLCGGSATVFGSASAKMEYAVSAICQSCQDHATSCADRGERGRTYHR